MEISTQKIGYQKYNNGVMDIKKYFKYRVPVQPSFMSNLNSS